MHITLSPLGEETRKITVERNGDILTINGEEFDFTDLPDGATIPEIPSEWFGGPVDRIDGVLHICLRFPIPHGATEAQRFPEPIIDPPNGLIALPPDPQPAPESENVEA